MLKIKTAPIVEPVLGTDVQDYLRLDSTEYNTSLGNYAIAARTQAEEYTRRAFITQTWYLSLDEDEISADFIKIPRPPLSSIVSITTTDYAGTNTINAPSVYIVDTYSEPGRVFLAPEAWWGIMRPLKSMLIEFIAGYGAAASNVPLDIRIAITEAAAYYYASGEVGQLPQKVKDRLKPYQVQIF